MKNYIIHIFGCNIVGFFIPKKWIIDMNQELSRSRNHLSGRREDIGPTMG